MDKAKALANLTGVEHGFFGRVSPRGTPFNISANFDDMEAVRQNRTTAINTLNVQSAHLATVKQTHSNDVITLTSPPDPQTLVEADGMVTNLPKVALGILTADCTPILFADPNANIIGACHAGWKGAVNGIIENTVEAMKALGAKPDQIIAAIGPTISAPNYEVGPEFADNLGHTAPAALPFITYPDGTTRAHFDLPGFAKAQLAAAGIKSIDSAGGCTYANPALYFSHRHTTHHGTKAGRQIALIIQR